MRVLSLCSIFLLFFCCTQTGQAFELIRNRQACFSVMLPENPDPAEQRAREELAICLRKSCDAELTDNADQIILIGTADRLPDLPEKVRHAFSNRQQNDTFYLLTTEKILYVVGNRPFAALAGTCELLEKAFGVRWFYPGESGEHYPQHENLTLPGIDQCQTADFKYREFNICGNSTNFPSTYDWLARNKMYGSGPHSWQLPNMTPAQKQEYRQALGAYKAVGGHEFFREAVPPQLLEQNPEMFALKNGKRTAEGRINRCLSHPGVIRNSAEYYRNAFRENPATLGVFIGEDDSNAFCECELCQQMGTWNGKFSISNLFHLFFQKIAVEVLQEFPQADLEFFAYWNYRTLPENPAAFHLSSNSYVLYATHQRCYAHPFNAENLCNREIFDGMLAWKACNMKLGIYDYRYDSGCFYAPFEEIVASDLKTFHQLGVVKWTDETNAGEGNVLEKHPQREVLMRSNWQSHYVAAKLLWNSSLSFEEVLQDAYNFYYGKTATAMTKYHALRQILWKNAPGHCVINGPERTASCLNVPGSEQQLLELLEEAQKSADSEIIRQRIAFDRHCLQVFWQEPAEKLRQLRLQSKDMLPVRAQEEIRIDGQFTEQIWLKAQPVEGFVVPDLNRESSEKTLVRLAYDADNLYLAVNAENKHAWSAVKAVAADGNGAVWEDDSIEIQIVPPHPDGEFYHWIINTRGAVYDAAVNGTSGNRDFDSQAEVKVVFDAQTWQYEIRIPLAPMRAEINHLPWKLHVMRTITNLQPPNTDEWSSFDGVRPFQTERFRFLVFGQNLIRNGNFSLLHEKEWVPGQKSAFPEHWELAGQSLTHFRVEPCEQGHFVWTSGTFFTGLPVPKEQKTPAKYVFTVRARGTGSLSARIWAWEGYQPRTNHRNLQLPKFELSADFQNYIFEVPFLPNENHMIFYIDGPDKTVQNVACTVQEADQK